MFAFSTLKIIMTILNVDVSISLPFSHVQDNFTAAIAYYHKVRNEWFSLVHLGIPWNFLALFWSTLCLKKWMFVIAKKIRSYLIQLVDGPVIYDGYSLQGWWWLSTLKFSLKCFRMFTKMVSYLISQ
jgi:hypothetical protein